MAVIGLAELLSALDSHELYHSNWEKGVPISESFFIPIADKPQGIEVVSETFDLANGGSLIIDIGSDGKIYAVEFA